MGITAVVIIVVAKNLRNVKNAITLYLQLAQWILAAKIMISVSIK